MIYIITALKSEAQAFVEYGRLEKSKLDGFTLFSNEFIRVIISGIGVEKARLATQTLIDNFDITDEDAYINVGICAASRNYKIGEVVECGTIVYEDEIYTFLPNKEKIYCVNEPMSSEEYPLVDMESYGVYDAVSHNPAIKKFFIFKVVSDHFEPHTVTKEQTKSLLLDAINNFPMYDIYNIIV